MQFAQILAESKITTTFGLTVQDWVMIHAIIGAMLIYVHLWAVAMTASVITLPPLPPLEFGKIEVAKKNKRSDGIMFTMQQGNPSPSDIWDYNKKAKAGPPSIQNHLVKTATGSQQSLQSPHASRTESNQIAPQTMKLSHSGSSTILGRIPPASNGRFYSSRASSANNVTEMVSIPQRNSATNLQQNIAGSSRAGNMNGSRFSARPDSQQKFSGSNVSVKNKSESCNDLGKFDRDEVKEQPAAIEQNQVLAEIFGIIIFDNSKSFRFKNQQIK